MLIVNMNTIIHYFQIMNQCQTLEHDKMSNSNGPESEFIHRLHKIYGIPTRQLNQIYLAEHSINSESTHEINDPSDYGDKLILNHNILKKMLSMLDTKSTDQSNPKDTLHHQICQNNQDLRAKLAKVSERLKEIIELINKDTTETDSCKLKGIIEMPKMQEQISNYKPSILHYSKVISNTNIVIDKNKLEAAKEVTSQYLLGQVATNEPAQLSPSYLKLEMKSSLEHIEEVQSGQTIIEHELQRKQRKQLPINESNHSHVNHLAQIVQAEDQEDQTGRIILSTITKKITSSFNSKFKEVAKQQDKEITPESVQDNKSAKQLKKSKFWANRKGKLENLTHNMAISHEVLSETKLMDNQGLKNTLSRNMAERGNKFIGTNAQSRTNLISISQTNTTKVHSPKHSEQMHTSSNKILVLRTEPTNWKQRNQSLPYLRQSVNQYRNIDHGSTNPKSSPFALVQERSKTLFQLHQPMRESNPEKLYLQQPLKHSLNIFPNKLIPISRRLILPQPPRQYYRPQTSLSPNQSPLELRKSSLNSPPHLIRTNNRRQQSFDMPIATVRNRNLAYQIISQPLNFQSSPQEVKKTRQNQLERIIQISEGSIQNTPTRQEMVNRYAVDINSFRGVGSQRLKKKGIQITNQLPFSRLSFNRQ